MVVVVKFVQKVKSGHDPMAPSQCVWKKAYLVSYRPCQPYQLADVVTVGCAIKPRCEHMDWETLGKPIPTALLPNRNGLSVAQSLVRSGEMMCYLFLNQSFLTALDYSTAGHLLQGCLRVDADVRAVWKSRWGTAHTRASSDAGEIP